MFGYDNTLKIKLEANSNKHLLNVQAGKEKQLYNIGDIVKTNSKCSYAIDKAVIIDVYNNNGYYNYTLKYNISKRKTNTYTIRQIDIGRKA